MNSLTVVELKKLAKSKGIKGYSKLRKGELLSALNRSPSRSKSPKVRKSRSRSGKRRSAKRSRSRSGKRRSAKRSKSPKSRSGKRRSIKSPKSRSANRRSGKKDYTISIKPYFVPFWQSDKDNYVPSDAEIGKFIQQHAVKEIKQTIRDIEIFNTGTMGVKFLTYNPSTRTLFFNVPGKYPRKQVEDFVEDLRDYPLEDTAYEGPAGKGLVLPRGGEIDFRKGVKLM